MGSESKNAVGLLQLPHAMRKVVDNLKEIVNCSEVEIYQVLQECNMDPNEAVQRLLSQDSFHKVKSKRERRKEIKETQESRSRVNCSGLARRPRSSGERNIGWGGSTQTNSNEFGSVAYKGENGFVAPPPHLTTHVTGKTLNQQMSSQSNSLNTDSGRQSIGTGDFISASVQPSSGCHSAWSGDTEHLSMADVVRMGRLPNKGLQIASEASCVDQDRVTANSNQFYVNQSQVSAPLQLELCHDRPSQNHSNGLEMFCQPGITAGQNDSLDEWPLVEQPTAARGSLVLETSVASASAIYSNLSNFHGNGSNMSRNHHSDDGQVSEEDFTGKRRSSDRIDSVSASASSEQKFAINAVETSHCDEDFHQYSSSYDSRMPSYKYEEASGSCCGSNLSIKNLSVCSTDKICVAVSSAAENLQRISLGKGDPEDNRMVVLPNHLQALAVDCSHLSFGTYKSGTGSSLASSLSSNQLKDDLEGASTTIDSLSSGHLNPRHRNPGYYGDDPLASLYEFHRATAHARNYNLSAPSQPELIKRDVPETTLGHEYIRPSLHDSKFENIEQASSGLSFSRADSKIGNIPFLAETAYSNSMPSDLLVPTIQSLRRPDHLHSQFHVTQSMPSRYSNALPSISSSTVSLSEVLKPGTFSLSEPSSLLPRDRTAYSYSEPTLPLEQLANMVSYPNPHQSYLHAPSTIQQPYPGGGIELHQSLDGMKYSLPQYNKSGALIGRLPASASSGYGGFVNSTNVPGGYLNRPSAASMITTSGCNEILRPQYKDGSYFTSSQQNNSSSTWNHPSLRTQLPVTDSAYYSLLGHNQQQHAGHRQGQQSSQHYGSLGYSNYYGSQTGITHGHQQQSLSDFTVGGTEDLSAQQLPRFWQQSY
ncbi:hypothetical protein FNV43_RR14677 [Rhamnella rubrinervis]|uniref:GBF-interacting protein 1 N-terminal domain-containing protein n=1 Tax=Rhamnella rubrinervis TaxID=2594499 RepID=A0A8K0H3J1_9ROSA|nr:hypothetical protein FNV43_RR14677 [Rhamnella rubrinervis]